MSPYRDRVPLDEILVRWTGESDVDYPVVGWDEECDYCDQLLRDHPAVDHEERMLYECCNGVVYEVVAETEIHGRKERDDD